MRLLTANPLTSAEDNGWGPGIPNLEREDWDWGAASGRPSSNATTNGGGPGGWSRQRSGSAAESTWNGPGTICINPLVGLGHFLWPLVSKVSQMSCSLCRQCLQA